MAVEAAAVAADQVAVVAHLVRIHHAVAAQLAGLVGDGAVVALLEVDTTPTAKRMMILELVSHAIQQWDTKNTIEHLDWELTYDADGYLALLDTFSGHIAIGSVVGAVTSEGKAPLASVAVTTATTKSRTPKM